MSNISFNRKYITMATIKSYTDLSQSKTLSNILPLESADMHYCLEKRGVATGYEIGTNPFIKAKRFEGKCNVVDVQPAWSLAALLSVLPDELGDNHFLTLDKEGNEYCCCYEDVNGNSFRHTFADNPINACVAMIEKLDELNLL